MTVGSKADSHIRNSSQDFYSKPDRGLRGLFFWLKTWSSKLDCEVRNGKETEWSKKTQHKCCLKILMPNHLLKDLQAKLTLESHFLHFKYILTCTRVCALRSPGQFDRWLVYLGSDLTHSNTVLRLYYCAEH